MINAKKSITKNACGSVALSRAFVFYICRGALFYDFEFVAVGDRNRASSVRNFDTYEAAGNGEARRTRSVALTAAWDYALISADERGKRNRFQWEII